MKAMTKEQCSTLQCHVMFLVPRPSGNPGYVLTALIITMTIIMIIGIVTQSPKNLVGASAMPTGKFLRVRKVFARIYKIVHKMKPKHQLKSE